MQRLDERAVVTQNFQRVFGRPPNLQIPTTFNEKIAYKILYDRRPVLTRLADKLRARDYIAERIGAEYLTELYQVCGSPDAIDWLKLPQRFVIKMNHGCRMNIFVVDKSRINVSAIASQLDRWRATNHYHYRLEWAYRDIRPAILIEEMVTEENGAMPFDWNFYTFDGRAEFLSVKFDQFGQRKLNYYDRRLIRLPLRRGRPNAPTDPRFPGNINLMFSLADWLGSGLDFVRVDMYNVGGRIVLGELTNYPDSGMAPFYPPEFDEVFGSKWRWPPPY